MTDPLHDYHDRVLSILGRAAALLDGIEPDTRALGQCRWELVRMLRAYQIHKHRDLFDPVIAAGGPPGRVALARRLKAACIAMGDRFRAYLMRWCGRSMCDQWPEYRPAALAMIAELRAHIEHERAGIETLRGGARAPAPPAPRPGATGALRF